MKKSLVHGLTIVILTVLTLGLTGCQHLTDVANDLGDCITLGWSRGGGIIFGPGGGIEIGVKATELIHLDVGASEMWEREIMNTDSQLYWSQSLGFPFAPIYMGVTDTLPEPVVAHRAQPGRWYMHTVTRHHEGPFLRRWKAGVQPSVPPSLRGQAQVRVIDTSGLEGLNSYFLVTPFLDSSLPVIDRFELGADVKFLLLGLHLGINTGQIVDLFPSLVGLDIANDSGRTLWLRRAWHNLRGDSGPAGDLSQRTGSGPSPFD